PTDRERLDFDRERDLLDLILIIVRPISVRGT
ncbi:MAG: hypothetical protein ACI9IV_001585, partial [Paracoccaceae bacterium]